MALPIWKIRLHGLPGSHFFHISHIKSSHFPCILKHVKKLMLFIQLFSYKMSRQEAAGPFVLPNLLSHHHPPRHRPQPNPKTGLFRNISLPSKRRPLLRYKQSFHIHPFMLQQPYLFINTTGVSGQTSGCTHHSVARYDNGNRIMAHCSAHCLG